MAPSFRLSRSGFVAAGLFLFAAASIFSWVFLVASQNPADSGESGILLLPFAMPWISIIPGRWLGLGTGLGCILLNAFIVYCAFGGFRIRTSNRPGGLRTDDTSSGTRPPSRLRWVLVPLSGIGVWYAVLALGLAGYRLLDHICPPDRMISDHCAASWHAPAVNALLLFCAATVSVGIVVVPALVAPAHSLGVAVFAFGFGAILALWVAIDGSLWGPFSVAAIAGMAALWLLARKVRNAKTVV